MSGAGQVVGGSGDFAVNPYEDMILRTIRKRSVQWSLIGCFEKCRENNRLEVKIAKGVSL